MSGFYPLVTQLHVALSVPNMSPILFKYFLRQVQLGLYQTVI